LATSRAAGKGANCVARQDVDEQGQTGAGIGSSLATGLDAGSDIGYAWTHQLIVGLMLAGEQTP
jgi:hypothetical protein